MNRMPWVGVWLLVGLFAVPATMALVAMLITVGQLGIDPTERTFAVSIQNDTSNRVVLKQCDTTCASYHQIVGLAPGKSFMANTSAGDVPNWWLVATDRGFRLGCIDLLYGEKATGVVVNVSHMVKCP